MSIDQWDSNLRKLLSLYTDRQKLLSAPDKDKIRQEILVQVRKRSRKMNNMFWRLREILFLYVNNWKNSIIILTAIAITLIILTYIPNDWNKKASRTLELSRQIVPFNCFVSKTSPKVDGKINKNEMWSKALPLSKGSFFVKGVVHNNKLYVEVESKGDHIRRFDNNTLMHSSPHIDVSVANLDKTEVYRVFISSDGSVYEAKQVKSKKVEGWDNDLTWRSNARVFKCTKSDLTAEFDVPITDGWINVSDKTDYISEPPSDWHNIKLNY